MESKGEKNPLVFPRRLWNQNSEAIFEILKESFSHKKARKLTNEQKNDISNGGLQYQMIDPRKKAMGEATELL